MGSDPEKSLTGFVKLLQRIVVAGLVFLWLSVSAYAQVKVFVAASLIELMEEAGREFEAETGQSVGLIVAGTSTLAQQIVAGAPADIFISANRDWLEFVRNRAGFGKGVPLFSNKLVVVKPENSDLVLTDLADLPDILQGQRLAIGDPDQVPAGIYAQQALRAAGVWEDVAGRLAPAANVRAALQLVMSGAAPVGIVYGSDVSHPGVEIVLPIDSALHEEIVYLGALSPEADGIAKRFFAFLQSMDVKNLALDFGFARLEGMSQ